MLKFVLLFLLFLNANLAFSASSTPPSCGINKKCADGYYCSGAIGESESGVCVANGINILMCRFIDYFSSDIVKILFIFAIAFLGLYFFIGKVNLNIVAQMLIGMSIIVGASGLVANLLGTNKGLCGKAEALECINNVTNETPVGISVPRNTNQILNLTTQERTSANYDSSGATTQCGLLGCVRANCPKYSRGGTATSPTCSNASGTETVWVKVGALNFAPKNCQGGFGIRCTPYVATYNRDYFYCKSCTGNNFAGEAPSAWGIANCKELLNKNVKP